MGFLAPAFLAGLLAVGLPVYIHLLRKRTTVPRPFSSLMFFEQGRQSSVRHRRLRYLLLFSLRTALVALLALAFAQPFLRRSAVFSRERLLVLAIDDSFSMNARSDRGTRLEEAKRQALAVLARRRPEQMAQIVVLAGQLHVLTQPTRDGAALLSAIEGIAPGDSHGTFGELGRGMSAAVQGVHSPVDLHLFSDMQQSNMPANFAEMALPPGVALTLHRIGEESAVPNWTVASVEAPATVTDPKKARVTAVIAGYGTPAASESVSLIANGRTMATQRVSVPADGRATAVFDGLDVPYGESRCAVRIDPPDALPEDNEALFAVRRADPRRVLFVHRAGDTRSPLYFGAALAAAAQGRFVMQAIAPEEAADVDPAKYAFVVLSDVAAIPSMLEHAMARYVEAGGGVLIAAGDALAQPQAIPVFGGSTEAGRYYDRGGGWTTLGRTDESAPGMQQAGAWSATKFFYATKVDAGDARVTARLADGTPLLMDKQLGAGRVLLFASGLDDVTNDLAIHPAFVAFVNEMARNLSGDDVLGGTRVVDSYVELRGAGDAAGAGRVPGGSVDVIDPEGGHALSLGEAANARALQLRRAGFYEVRFGNGREALIAVNPDRRESDLRVIPADVLQLWAGEPGRASGSDQGSSAETVADRSPVWWWFMLLLTITALAESVLASEYLGVRREQP